MDKVTYFLRGEGASIIVEPGTAKPIPKSSPAGVFATQKPEVKKALARLGYEEVDTATLERLELEAPPPDKLDWTRWDSPKYQRWPLTGRI